MFQVTVRIDGQAVGTHPLAEGANIVGLELDVVSLRARVLDASGAEVAALSREAPTDVQIVIDAVDVDRATLVLSKGADHAVTGIRLRKI